MGEILVLTGNPPAPTASWPITDDHHEVRMLRYDPLPAHDVLWSIAMNQGDSTSSGPNLRLSRASARTLVSTYGTLADLEGSPASVRF